MAQGTLDEINLHQNSCVKSKFNISICRIKSYQITDLEDILYRFDQVIPMVSHFEVILPDKTITPNNIGEYLKGPQRQLWNEALFVQYNKNQNVGLLLDPIPIKSIPEGTKVLCFLIAPSIK